MSFDHLDIESKRLEEFLQSAEGRPFSPSERLRRLRQLFGDRGQPKRALEELHPYRIMALWRITRLTLEVKGRLAEDERLEDATTVTGPSPWDHPTRPVGHNTPRRRTGGLVARHLEDDGLPLLCPQGHGELTRRWCDAAGVAAGILSIASTERGQMGLDGLLDPDLAPSCCPTAEQVLAFEEQLISEAVELLVEHGEPVTMHHYRQVYGLTRRESLTVVRLARDLLRQEMEAPVEENRAVAIAMLKRYIEEVANTPNMRDRLLAIKELVRVQGVTREAPEDAMKDFLNVVRTVSEKREERELNSGKGRIMDALPAAGGTGEHAEHAAFEVVEDEDDREALETYDKENHNA